MRKSKLILTVMTLLLLFASFLSVPALSGEDPWDADDGDSGTPVTPPDSADNYAGTLSDSQNGLVPGSPNSGDGPLDWFSGIMTRMSIYIADRYNKWMSPKAQVRTAY